MAKRKKRQLARAVQRAMKTEGIPVFFEWPPQPGWTSLSCSYRASPLWRRLERGFLWPCRPYKDVSGSKRVQQKISGSMARQVNAVR